VKERGVFGRNLATVSVGLSPFEIVCGGWILFFRRNHRCTRLFYSYAEHAAHLANSAKLDGLF